MTNKLRYLTITAAVCGMSTISTQIAVSRLLAPYFGTSLPVLAGVLSLVMVALAIGYYMGGRMADKHVSEKKLYTLILATGIYIGLIPFVFIPLTKLATYGIEQVGTTYQIGNLIIALVLMVLFLILPFVALGMFIPYLIKLQLGQQPTSVASTAGSVLCWSVIGGIVGTILSTFFVIPTIGTAKSVLICSICLMLISIIATKKWLLLLLPLGAILSTALLFQIKPEKGLIFETESMYNYIQVFNIGGTNILRLNEGHAEHSLYQKDRYLLVGGVWDYYLLLGLINHGKNTLSIGLGAGTFASQYTRLIPGSQVDGIDIDPAIIEAGKRYFGLENVPGLQAFATDGRLYLQTTSKRYDNILIDAYKQPYIPFHLTTQEFFQAIQHHLGNNGIVGINVGSTEPNSPVLLKIENTMKSVFKHVYRLHVARSLNYFVWATDYDFDYNAIQLEPHQEVLRPLLQYMQQQAREINHNPQEIILRDNLAPLELSTEKMILDFALEFKQ